MSGCPPHTACVESGDTAERGSRTRKGEKEMNRLMAAMAAVLMTGGLVACGGGDNGSAPTPVPTPPTKAVVTFNVDPNPVVSEYQGDGWYRFKVNLEFYDTAGVGFNINTVRTTVQSSVTSTILLDYDYSVASHVGA